MTGTKAGKGRVIVCGILFWYPLAGVTYQFLHYLLGLRRLGWDVWYIEDSSKWVYDPGRGTITQDPSRNLAHVVPVLERHGFGDRWAFRGTYEGGDSYGMTEEAILRLYGEADALFNVTAAQWLTDEHLVCPVRIYIESDPFSSQVQALKGEGGKRELLAAHTHHFTFGENVGAPWCAIPDAGHRWYPTRQPVVVDLWDNDLPAGSRFTSVTTWHSKVNDVTHEGETYYWTKDREWLKVLELPSHTSVNFRLAVDMENPTVLKRAGWETIDAVSLSRHTSRYRSFICGSRGEFTVARDQYVRPRTGWFSDRSACYLAAARPVVTQETGFSDALPTGKGLHSWRTTDDALAALDEVETDYEGNCRAAREIAEEYFSADRVLGELLTRAGL